MALGWSIVIIIQPGNRSCLTLAQRFQHPASPGGTYRIAVTSPAPALPPVFLVASARALHHRLVLHADRYFISERDAANVVGKHASGTRAIAPVVLLDDLAAQLRVGEGWARREPFGLGTALGSSDASPHAFGLAITDAVFRCYAGSGAFGAFAQ